MTKKKMKMPKIVDEREEKTEGPLIMLEDMDDFIKNVNNRISALEGGVKKVWEKIDEIADKGYPDFDPILDRIIALEKITRMDEEEGVDFESLKEEKLGTRTYTVVKGDTMAKIAKKLLGSSGRFNEISTINYERYPSLRGESNSVEPGWVLALP